MDRSTHVWWYSCTNPHICLEVHPSAGLLADEEPAQVEVGMVLGNVASSPLLDGTRSIQLSSISSTPYRTPCGPQLRFGRRITSIERLGGSPLVPRLLSFHGSAAVEGIRNSCEDPGGTSRLASFVNMVSGLKPEVSL